MYEPSFIKRLTNLGTGQLLKSYDTFAGVLSILVVYILTDGHILEDTASDIIISFASVSAGLFAIILTGLTIITTFTDRYFLYAWQKVGEFENLVTYFQYNLILPIVVILYCTFLHLYYNSYLMIILIGVFVYLLFSLLNLMALICRYALQRGEYIRKQLEEGQIPMQKADDRLSKAELIEIRDRLQERVEDQE